MLAVLVAVGAALLWARPPSAARSMVFLNGDIVTMGEPRVVEALWVEGGVIRALGSRDEVLRLAGRDAGRFDLDHATLMPNRSRCWAPGSAVNQSIRAKPHSRIFASASTRSWQAYDGGQKTKGGVTRSSAR